ncbi:uncharacterized protein PV06_02789 [Exophiala oligosperma]|uniref:Zn(2)-C6 fungal-type domain-containing protein n=1 Tax=Exophiala oligosperma TaxID=215243 RepID=A0A0D2EGV9_9EURO|nr:uncharacterized protein PV06_02789 [Exophiala oligosperma]KIW47194.1 hypothetical protein PV06_02789 [Exophiala oligosperma]
MVGIARSRGCATCRKRKIACGLQQPSCAQCIRSKRTCTGYLRHPIIIQHKVPRHNTHARSKKAEQPIKHQIQKVQLEPKEPCYAQVSLGAQGDASPSYEKPSMISPADLQINSTPAIRQQLLQEYLHYHLPKPEIGMPPRRMWLLRLPELTYMTPALEYASMAVCLAKLGNVFNDQACIKESFKLYNRGLWHLQQALWDPELMLHDHTLTACISLASYELSECPNSSKDAYINHTKGCQALVKLRGPEAHAHGLAHQVFVHFRVQGILYALDQQRPTFLSEPAWREIPWQNEAKTAFDKAYDLLALAPEFLGKARMFGHLDLAGQLNLALSMIPQCWVIDREVSALWDSMEKSQPSPLFWPRLAQSEFGQDDADEARLFPVAFHFPNLGVAHCLLICWTVQTILWHGMKELYRLMGELEMAAATFGRVEESIDPDSESGRLRTALACSGNVFDLPPLEHRAEFVAPARNIFQSVEFCMMEDTVDQGPKSLAAPLRVATEILRPYPDLKREVEFGDKAMAKIQLRSLKLLQYYTGIEI